MVASDGFSGADEIGSPESISYDNQPFNINNTSQQQRLMTRRRGSEDAPSHMAGLTEFEIEFLLARRKAGRVTIAKPFPQ